MSKTDYEMLTERIEQIEQIINKYENIWEFEAVKKDIITIRNKIQDDYLYLGVVGTFSSGKSTFINSIIGKNILPMNAVQGTTVATSVLKKGNQDDIEIKYIDGRFERYSTNSDYFCEKYNISQEDKDYIKRSFIKKILELVKKIFGIGRKQREEDEKKQKIEKIRKLYRYIISTEEVAGDIEFATLYINNNSIEYNIALVDTPGTESLNNRHNEVTKNAIDSICDALVIIIPFDEPVSESLIAYIQNNIDNYKEKCIFAVTKVELLDEQDELPGLLEWIIKKIKQRLEIENPIVIPMPTFIHLKNVDKEFVTSFLDEMSNETKEYLLEMFDNGIKILSEALNERRNRFVSENISMIYKKIITYMKVNLKNLMDENRQENIEIVANNVPALNEFEDNILKKIKGFMDSKTKDIDQSLIEVTNCIRKFYDEIFRKIFECKDINKLISDIRHSNYKQLSMEIWGISIGIEKEYEDDKRVLFQQIKREYYEKYMYCYVEGDILAPKVQIDLDKIEDKINFIESELQNHIYNFDLQIKQSRKGLINKVKNVISNPTESQKEYIKKDIQKLNTISNELISTEWKETYRKYYVEYENNIKNAFKNMVKKDSTIINEYIKKNNKAITENLKLRDELIKDLSMLDYED